MLNIAMVVSLIKELAPQIDPSDIETAVSDWLAAHPEATTTVQDGSITEEKLASDVLLTLSTLESDVSDVKNAIEGIDESVEKKASAVYGSADAKIIRIKDAEGNADVNKLTAVYIPMQNGSGDPSAQNVRPFIGKTGCVFTRIDENILNIDQYDEKFREMTIDVNNDQVITSKVYGGTSSFIKFSQTFPKGTYTFFGDVKGTGSNGLRFLSTAEITGGTWNNYYGAYWKKIENGKITFTVSEDTKIGIVFITATENDPATAYNLRLTKDTYNEYALSWLSNAGTLYGFIADVSGKVIKTHERIASYNGETLPGVWYSDRDVYEEGQTPTIGAEVVYKLSEDVEYDIASVTVKLKYGSNIIWNSCECINSIVYRTDTKEFINNKIKEETETITDRITSVNPKMFGAVGDGIEDDSIAIQATFDYAKLHNVPIDVSNGSYLFENVVLYDGGRYEINGALSIEDDIWNNQTRTPSLIVKHNSVGFIGDRSSQEVSVSSLPTVYIVMRNLLIKGENGSSSFPVIFKDVVLVNAKIQNIVACWFSCFVEGVIKGNSVIAGNEFHFFTECVFRSWTDKYEINPSHSFVDSKYYNNQFYGTNKINNTLYTPTVFEGNYFYINGFENNFVAMMFGVVGLIRGSNVTAWISKNNIYSFCPYFFVLKSEAQDPFIYASILKDESIWHTAADTLKNSEEGKGYFDDYAGNSRITGNECNFFNFDSFQATEITGTVLRDYDPVFREVTKFQYSRITKAFPYVGVDFAGAQTIDSAFDTKIPLTDYTQNTDGYIATTIEAWNGKTVQTLPTIADSNYRYVLDGQTCYYNNKLLICHGSNWYDTMGNVIS